MTDWLAETKEEIYLDYARMYPDKFKLFLKLRDDNCSDCSNYEKMKVKGVQARGCKANINFEWALRNDCTDRKQVQTNILDMIGGNDD